jgi:endonuclease YncB( thermonuclease family)
MNTLIITMLAALTIAPFPAGAAEISGIVTEVQDGDSLTLVNWQATYKIRLADIDAPEWKQPRGKDSRASLFHLCGLRRATAETTGEDRFGRTLARVTCAGIDANSEQVRRGMAWVFIRYAPKDSPLYRVEAEARAERRGLWEDSDPVPPWDWRAKHVAWDILMHAGLGGAQGPRGQLVGASRGLSNRVG